MQEYPEFFVGSGTVRVDLDDQHWVDIKEEMAMGQWEVYESSMLQAEAERVPNGNENRETRRRRIQGQQQSEVKTSLKMSTGDIILLELNIVGWSFQDVPINKSNISNLKERWCRLIISAISEANPTSPLEAASQSSQT